MLKMVRKVVDTRNTSAVGFNDGKIYDLKQAWINPEQMIVIERDDKTELNVKLGLFRCEGVSGANFTRVVFSNGETIVVLGSPDVLMSQWRCPLLKEVGHAL